MSTRVTVDIVPDEIITTQSTITFQVPAKADTSELARHILVPGVNGRIRATRGKNEFRWSPPEDMAGGRYTLVCEQLTDRRSRALTPEAQIPFTVIETPAKISSRLRIESFSRVRLEATGVVRVPIGETPRGRYVDFFKVSDRRSGKLRELAFDQDGKRVDPKAAVAEFRKATVLRYGNVHPAVVKRARKARKGEALRVDIWLDVDEPSPTEADRPQHAGDIERAARRAEETRGYWQSVAKEFADQIRGDIKVVRIERLAPLLVADVPAGAVRRLGADKRVALVMLHEEEGREDLDDSIAISRSGVVHATGERGSGVRVAVWESGPTSNADLVIADRFKNNPTTSNHSQNVHAIIRNDEDDTPDGHAPRCSLYSANSKKRSALTWAVEEKECTVINQSFHRSSEPEESTLSSDDLYGDWLALHWPYPLIVHAAGNFWDGDPDNIDPPSDEYVNHKGYNTISVGNHNDDADAMRGSSVFRNPSSPHGDRELPEIAANGTSVTADGITMTGTSQASPAVAGIAALLQGAEPTLKHWPEGCRAILAAGADRNVSDGTWWQDVSAGVDASDGAGAVNARQSQLIAGNRRWRGAPATQQGWDIGLLTSNDFGTAGLSEFEYNVQVPPQFWAPRDVKIALAWTSAVRRLRLPIFGDFFFSNLAVDLDLKVFDSAGNQVGYSGSWDNSYEIVEFKGMPGETYTIRIRRWSGDEPTWFGIAWTVTGGLLIPIPVEILEAVRWRR